MIHVLFVCTEVGGVNWFRAAMPHQALEETKKRGEEFGILFYDPEMIIRRNWEFDLYGDPNKAWQIKYDVLNAVGWADVVVWMGLHSPDSLELLKMCKMRFPQVKMLMELDDYLLSSSRSNPGAADLYKYGGDLAKIGLQQMRISDGLIVSTPTLADLYKPYAKKIWVVENTVDLSLWPKPKVKKEGKLTIGWIGAGSHDDDLFLIKNAVDRLLDKHKDIEFSIVHGCPEFFKHKADCEYLYNPRHPLYKKLRRCEKCGGIPRVHWTHDFKTIDKYPKWAASFGFDIGLAPLVDLNFTRGKSNLRWLEYSAMGIPTIASPLNHFVETIRDGETGLIVKDNSEQGWFEAIDRLILDPDLRKAIGGNAREEVKKNWSPAVMAQKYRKALKELTHAQHDAIRTGHKDRPIDSRHQQPEVHGGAEAERDTEGARAVCS